MAKNKLSIYLIKQDFPVEDIIPRNLAGDNPVVELQVNGYESYKLFARTTKAHEPGWVETFFNSVIESEFLKVANIGAALVIRSSLKMICLMKERMWFLRRRGETIDVISFSLLDMDVHLSIVPPSKNVLV